MAYILTLKQYNSDHTESYEASTGFENVVWLKKETKSDDGKWQEVEIRGMDLRLVEELFKNIRIFQEILSKESHDH